MNAAEFLALPEPDRFVEWTAMSPDARQLLWIELAASTPSYALPYPTDYNLPADSPAALQALATATDAALVSLDNRFVKSPMGIQVTDWDQAVYSGFYWSAPATANQPAMSIGDDYWMAVVSIHNTDWVHQLAWPLGAVAYPVGATMHRAKVAGVWSGWVRVGTSLKSWGQLDGFVAFDHGGQNNGVRRFAHGSKKDPATTGNTNVDEYRVQCYDPAGTFTWSAIKIPENGHVYMPRGYSTTMAALAADERVSVDSAATVGVVVELVRRLLEPHGVTITPEQVAALLDETPLADEEGT